MQSEIAQITTRYISDGPSEDSLENIPWLSAIEAMRYPTSPRATIANPRMEGGYRDFGFGGREMRESGREVDAGGLFVD